MSKYKRVLALIMALATVWSLLPFNAFATETNVPGESSTGEENIMTIAEPTVESALGGEIQFTFSTPVTYYADVSAGQYMFQASSGTTGSVLVTNTSTSNLIWNFKFEASYYAESITADGELVGSNGVTLYPGTSVTIGFTLSKTHGVLVMDNFTSEVASSGKVQFNYDSNLGYIKVNGTKVDSGAMVDIGSAGVPIEAVPNSGVTFLGWVNPADHTYNGNSSISGFMAPANQTVVQVVFAHPDKTAWFKVGDKLTDNLKTAVTLGSKVILAADGVLPAGDYNIPSGVTLLIPFDDAHTLYTDEPEVVSSYTKPTAYRTLTMATGANITIANGGAISVSGKQSAKQGSNSSPSGPQGFINMGTGSTITAQGNSNLYAWGYITGSGSVTIKSGATVHECFQVMDWRGGSVTSGMNNNSYRVFPFSQYYIQNVEVPMTLESGATEKCLFSVKVGDNIYSTPVSLIGNNALIRMTSGSVTKDYDEGSDRLIINVNGTASISPVTITVKVYVIITLPVKIDSASFVFPITNNMTININSGSNVTISQDLGLLPGTELTVGQNATCNVASGKSIYAYDGDDWGSYCYSGKLFKQVPYAPGRTVTRTGDSLVDAKILVNGKVDASSANIYTTSGGAMIYSTGNGEIVLNANTRDGSVYQATQSGTSWSPVSIAVTPAKLVNADGSIRKTAGVGGSHVFNSHHGGWAVSHAIMSLDTKPPQAEGVLKCQEIQYKTGYYYCDCGAYFSDAEGVNRVAAEDVETYINPHVPVEEWSFNAMNHWHECSYGCGTTLETTAHTDILADGDHSCDICASEEKISECYDLTLDFLCDECGNIYPDYDGNLQMIPAGATAETNLWSYGELQYRTGYHAKDGWSEAYYSITVPISAGDQIAATSLGTSLINAAGATKDGIRVTWFSRDGVLATWDPSTVYARYKAAGCLTAPEGAVAVNVPSWTENNEFYILTLPHGEGFVPNDTVYADHIKELPANACAGTNLWEAITEHDSEYYKESGWGTSTSNGGVTSLTVPVNGGDKIYSTSLFDYSGIRVTWFIEDGTVDSRAIKDVKAEYDANGYLTAPKRAVAVCVPFYGYTKNKVFNILDLPHSYNNETWVYDETGHWHACACGEKADFAAHDATVSCEICGYTSLYGNHRQDLPATMCAGTNLVEKFNYDGKYFKNGEWTTNTTYNSLTFYVNEGDQLWATSFQKAGLNGLASTSSTNGVQITWFKNDGTYQHMTAADVYASFSANGHVAVPAGVVAVNIPLRDSNPENAVYILNYAHDIAYTSNGDGTESGSCSICSKTETRAVASYLGTHIQLLPDNICAGTNLWPLLTREKPYFSKSLTSNAWSTYSDKWSTNSSVPDARSVTIPVSEGDKIWATSFQKNKDNGLTGSSTTDGVRVTWFSADNKYLSWAPATVYSKFNASASELSEKYIEAPANAVAVNITMWNSSEDNELYLLTAGHKDNGQWISDETGHWKQCTCGEIFAFAEHSEDDPCTVCGFTTSHSHAMEWIYDLNGHWQVCECGEKTVSANHLDVEGSTSCETCGYVYPSYYWHVSKVPATACAGTNLWPILPHETSYFKTTTNSAWTAYTNKWGTTSNVRSVTIPVTEGDRIWATSFQKKVDNGDSSTDGVRVTWFSADNKYLSWKPATVYEKFTNSASEPSERYIEAPANAIAVNIVMWNNSNDNELYLLTAGHKDNGQWISDETGHWKQCTCGEILAFAEHSEDDTCTVCGFATSHTHTMEWMHDDNGHWQECACGEKTESTSHQDVEGTTSCETCGYVYPYYYWYLSEVPANACGDTNLWPLLKKATVYVNQDKVWGEAKKPLESVTVNVKPGDQIYATSFSNIRIAWFYADGKIVTETPKDNEEYKEKGYRTVPDGVVAVSVPIYNDTSSKIFKILTLEHKLNEWTSDATNHWKVCASCSGEFETAAHSEGDACSVCGYTVTVIDDSLYKDYLSQVPANACGGTNLWPLLTKSDSYYKPGSNPVWNTPTSQPLQSVTVPISAGDQIYASSFKSGIRVTWFLSDGTVKSLEVGEVKGKTSLTAPTNAVAVNVPIYNSTTAKEFYILTLPHNSGTDWINDITGHWHACSKCTGKIDFAEHDGTTCTVCGYVMPANKSEKSDYKDLVISIMGDSISTYKDWIPAADGFNLQHISRYPDSNNQLTVEETWWHQLIFGELNAKLGINESWRSTEIGNIYDVEVNGGFEGTKACMASMTRIQNLGSNGTPDMILFYGGTNDITQSRSGGRVMGSFDASMVPAEVDLTTDKWDTVIEAYVTALMRMHHFYPNAKIVCMFPTVTSGNTKGTVAVFNAEFKKVCDHLIGMGYDIFYVDLLETGITAAQLPDGTHPSAEAMDMITNLVLNRLLRDCEMNKTPRAVYGITHTLEEAKAEKFYYKGVSAGIEFREEITGENLEVSVVMNGEELTDVYNPETNVLCIPNVTGAIEITATGTRPLDYYYGERLKQIPDDVCAGVNLSEKLGLDIGYFDTDGTWNTSKNKSLTLAVSKGDQLWASSFQAKDLNGASTNGVRITWFKNDGTYYFYEANETWAEFNANGCITVSDDVVAVNIFFRDADGEKTAYILNRAHADGNGDAVCDGCAAALEAKVGETVYTTLAAAVKAAGENDTIVVLADIEVTGIVNAGSKTIDFNGHSVKGSVFGKLMLNNGTLITAENKIMAGPNAEYYKTTNAVFTMDPDMNIDVLSGTIELAQNWWTLKNQSLKISEGANFVIPEGMTLQVLSTVVVEGTVSGNGTVNLYTADATITTTNANLTNITTSAGDSVLYVNGKYVVHNHNFTGKWEITNEGHAATCADANCAEVNKNVEAHKDDYKDHKCDVCEYEMSTCESSEHTTTYAHVDGTETHTVTVTCKVCGKQIGQATTEACADGDDTDTNCDKCAASVGKKVNFSNMTTTTTVSGAQIKIGGKEIDPDGAGAVLGADGVFTVTHDKACAVIVEIDNGDGTKTYHRLTAGKTAEENTYSFSINEVPSTVDTTAGDMQIIVAMKGDANQDGRISMADVSDAKNIYLKKYTDASELVKMIADTTGKGRISMADVSDIKNIYLKKNISIAWDLRGDNNE